MAYSIRRFQIQLLYSLYGKLLQSIHVQHHAKMLTYLSYGSIRTPGPNKEKMPETI